MRQNVWTTSWRLSHHYIDLYFAWKQLQARSTTLSRPKPGVNNQVILWISSSRRALGTLCDEKRKTSVKDKLHIYYLHLLQQMWQIVFSIKW